MIVQYKSRDLYLSVTGVLDRWWTAPDVVCDINGNRRVNEDHIHWNLAWSHFRLGNGLYCDILHGALLQLPMGVMR